MQQMDLSYQLSPQPDVISGLTKEVRFNRRYLGQLLTDFCEQRNDTEPMLTKLTERPPERLRGRNVFHLYNIHAKLADKPRIGFVNQKALTYSEVARASDPVLPLIQQYTWINEQIRVCENLMAATGLDGRVPVKWTRGLTFVTEPDFLFDLQPLFLQSIIPDKRFGLLMNFRLLPLLVTSWMAGDRRIFNSIDTDPATTPDAVTRLMGKDFPFLDDIERKNLCYVIGRGARLFEAERFFPRDLFDTDKIFSRVREQVPLIRSLYLDVLMELDYDQAAWTAHGSKLEYSGLDELIPDEEHVFPSFVDLCISDLIAELANKAKEHDMQVIGPFKAGIIIGMDKVSDVDKLQTLIPFRVPARWL